MKWVPKRTWRDSEWWWRPFRPRRTIWPTRDGWWCLFVVIGLRVAAINTGNNLPYLLVSLLRSLSFPFGLFVKASRIMLEADVVVFPAVRPISAEALQRLVGSGTASARRRGRGHDLYNLRAYRPGDDPRHIHWRSSAKTESLVVREMEAETTGDTRIVLTGTGAHDPARLEAALSEAASATVHLIRAGSGVELIGPGLVVPLGRGAGQSRRILTALALYQPGAFRAAPDTHTRGWRSLRELHIELG